MDDKVYFLISTFNTEICRGTYEQCEFALKALVTYGIREDKFEIVDAELLDLDMNGNLRHHNAE